MHVLSGSELRLESINTPICFHCKLTINKYELMKIAVTFSQNECYQLFSYLIFLLELVSTLFF